MQTRKAQVCHSPLLPLYYKETLADPAGMMCFEQSRHPLALTTCLSSGQVSAAIPCQIKNTLKSESKFLTAALQDCVASCYLCLIKPPRVAVVHTLGTSWGHPQRIRPPLPLPNLPGSSRSFERRPCFYLQGREG